MIGRPLLPAPTRADRIEMAIVAAIFVLLELLWMTFFSPYRIPYHYWQLLPARALAEDFWQSLLDLHAQPPALNVILGTLLKVQAATGIPAETLGSGLYLAVGAATVLGLWALARRLLPGRLSRLSVLVLVLANPYLYGCFSQLFYTPLEMALLVAVAVLATRFFDEPSARRLAGALAPAVLLVNTHSLFHPLWLAILAAALVAFADQRFRARWRTWAAVLSVGAFLVAAWPAKNLMRFGFFGFSSWSGINLSNALPISRAAVVNGLKSRRLSPALIRWLDARVPATYTNHPALAQATKPDGSPNWNHYAIIKESQLAGTDARRYLLDNPRALGTRAAAFYLGGFATYEGRDPYTDLFALDVARLDPSQSDLTAAEGWLSWYETVLFQRFRTREPTGVGRMTTGFAVLFPALLCLPLATLWARRRQFGTTEKTVALMLLCVAWVLVPVLLVDGKEGNRLRYSTEPFLVLAVVYALTSWLRPARSLSSG